MRDRGRLALLSAALAFFLAAGLLLRPALDRYGVSVKKLSLPVGTGVLYRSGDERAAGTAILADEDDDGHVHALTSAGKSAAALLLRERGDGADALAAELARRGVAVLAVSPGTDSDRAWEALTESDFARPSALAVLGGAEALALADRLAGGAGEPAAVILRGGGLLEPAASSRARNILLLAENAPDPDLLTAFLGEPERRPMAIGGYFAEGTARRAVRPAAGGWDRRETMLPVIDWLGSCLGHAVELPDDDLPTLTRKTTRAAAAACAALGAVCAGGAGLRRRKRSEER